MIIPAIVNYAGYKFDLVVKVLVNAIMLTSAFVDVFDLVIRGMSGISGVVFTFFLIKKIRSDLKRDKIDMKLKQQILEENKHKNHE